MTPSQTIILQFARANENRITKKEATKLIGHNYYHNAEKYVGETLSRMVKSNWLKRIKPGLFEVSSGTRCNPSTVIENQISLL